MFTSNIRVRKNLNNFDHGMFDNARRASVNISETVNNLEF